MDIYKFIIKYIFHSKSRIFALTINIIVLSICEGFLLIEIFRKIMDAIWTNNFEMLKPNIVYFFLLAVLQLLCTVLKKKLKFDITKLITYKCEDDLYDHYSQYQYWTADDTKSMLGKLRKLVPTTMEQSLNSFTDLFESSIVIISGCIYCGYLNIVTLLVCLLFTLIMTGILWKSLKKMPILNEQLTKEEQNLHMLTWEQINNLHIAKFLVPDKVIHNYKTKANTFLTYLLKFKKMGNTAWLLSSLGSMVSLVLGGVIGGIYIRMGLLTESSLLAFLMLIPSISAQLLQIPSLIGEVESLKGQVKPIYDTFSNPIYKQEGLADVSRIQNINLESVLFQYRTDQPYVVNGISLVLKPGLQVITGPSGSGKSTLLKLINKMIPLCGGSIKVNGQSIDSINRYSYWKRVAYLDQFPLVLQGSLLYNILLRDVKYEDLKEDEISRLQKAIQNACLEDFISRRGGNYDEWVDEKSLSKGEIQKLNIARLFYYEYDVLLLDEFSSALDPESEKFIINSLMKRSEENNAIIVCVSHRISILRYASNTYVCSDGKIIASGNHDSLYKTNHIYKKLVMEGEDKSEEF